MVVLAPASAVAVTAGLIKVVPSGPGELLRLLCTDVATGATRLAGRSYGGHPWETAPPAHTIFDCDNTEAAMPSTIYVSAAASRSSANCSTTIAANSTLQCRIEAHDFSGRNVSARAAASRLLMQATWGPDRASIDKVIAAGTASAWVHAQINVTATSHRAYLRARANPQFPQAPDSRTVHSVATGGARSSCTGGSRWVRFALTTADIGRYIALINGTGPSTKQVVLDNVLRTVVPATLFAALGESAMWRVCSVHPYQGVGGAVVVTNAADCKGPKSTLRTFANPPVEAPPTARIVVQTSDPTRLVAVSYRPSVPDTFVLVSGASPSELRCATAPLFGPQFAEVAGRYYLADQRVELLDNTLDHPAVAYDPHPLHPFSCPNVPKSFLNAHTCVTGVPSCVPFTFRDHRVKLDAAMLRQFYTEGGKLVYYVSGLEANGDAGVKPPCGYGVSRWIRQPARPAGVPCSKMSSDDHIYSSTLSLFSAQIEAARVHNNLVVDLKLGPGYCIRRQSLGISVDYNGECWRHSHPNELNVYDFTTWAKLHPGGHAAIGQFAVSNSVNLQFPPGHGVRRWRFQGPSRGSSHINLLGTFGDTVDFAAFPTSLKSEVMATLVGASFDTADVNAEVCGSPGEVANDPSVGFRFRFGQ